MTGKTQNRLRVLRAERGLTQLDISELTGIQVTRYWYIEKGYKSPTDEERKALAKAFGVRPSGLGVEVVSEAPAS